MEIREWIRAIGSRLALIAVVAGVAALLAGVLALFQPQQYRAAATFALPGVEVFGPATAATAQQVANIEAAVTSDGVLDAVAETTGAPRESLESVTVASSGSGNVVEVGYVGRDRDQAREVVVTAIREALVLQAETDLAFATAQERAAFSAYDEALQAFEDEAEATGHTAPDVELNVLNRKYLNAEEDDASDEELAEIQAEIVEVQEVQRLRDIATASLQRWGSAQEQVSQAQGQLDAATNAPVQGGDVVRLSKLQAMIKQGAYAALFGAALAVGFVIIVELLRSGTGTTRPSLPRPTRQRSSAGAF